MKKIEEIIAVATAFNEGKKIQVAYKGSGDWVDCYQPTWNWELCDYRVKPEPKIRPYANAKEFVDAMREHGFYLMKAEYGEPYLMATIVGESAYDVWIEGDNAVSYADILKYYKWQDGTPCGMEEGGKE